MSAQLMVVPDEDYVPLPGEQDMQNFVGQILAATYPGYRWRVEAYPHPTKPFFDIRPEEIAAVKIIDTVIAPSVIKRVVQQAAVGYSIKPWKFYSTSSLKREIIHGGGIALEAFGLSRKKFDLAEWANKSREKYTGLLVLPSGVA